MNTWVKETKTSCQHWKPVNFIPYCFFITWFACLHSFQGLKKNLFSPQYWQLSPMLLWSWSEVLLLHLKFLFFNSFHFSDVLISILPKMIFSAIHFHPCLHFLLAFHDLLHFIIYRRYFPFFLLNILNTSTHWVPQHNKLYII